MKFHYQDIECRAFNVRHFMKLSVLGPLLLGPLLMRKP